MDNKLGKEYYLISKSSQNKLYGIFDSIDRSYVYRMIGNIVSKYKDTFSFYGLEYSVRGILVYLGKPLYYEN